MTLLASLEDLEHGQGESRTQHGTFLAHVVLHAFKDFVSIASFFSIYGNDHDGLGRIRDDGKFHRHIKAGNLGVGGKREGRQGSMELRGQGRKPGEDPPWRTRGGGGVSEPDLVIRYLKPTLGHLECALEVPGIVT